MTVTSVNARRDNHSRVLYLLGGAALLVAAVAGAIATGTGASPVLLFAVFPDVAFVLAIGQPHERGQLPARAVPAYNLLHRPLLPLALAAAAIGGLLGPYWLIASLAWLAHIAIDRGCGYGLRTADGWQRG